MNCPRNHKFFTKNKKGTAKFVVRQKTGSFVFRSYRPVFFEGQGQQSGAMQGNWIRRTGNIIKTGTGFNLLDPVMGLFYKILKIVFQDSKQFQAVYDDKGSCERVSRVIETGLHGHRENFKEQDRLGSTKTLYR